MAGLVRGHNSIKRWLITIVVLSQTLLAAGWLFGGIFFTSRHLLSTLDGLIRARAMSVAALVRYSETADGTVYFDNSLMPPSLDPSHPDLFAVWPNDRGCWFVPQIGHPASKFPRDRIIGTSLGRGFAIVDCG